MENKYTVEEIELLDEMVQEEFVTLFGDRFFIKHNNFNCLLRANKYDWAIIEPIISKKEEMEADWYGSLKFLFVPYEDIPLYVYYIGDGIYSDAFIKWRLRIGR